MDHSAKSTTVHSYRVGARMATGLPGSIPRATIPLATARTWSLNSAAVTSAQPVSVRTA